MDRPGRERLTRHSRLIALDKPFYAARFVERIIVTAERLRDFPEMGRKVPESGQKDIRELIFQGYRIVYRLKPDCVQVLTVVHGSRDLTRGNPKPWEVRVGYAQAAAPRRG